MLSSRGSLTDWDSPVARGSSEATSLASSHGPHRLTLYNSAEWAEATSSSSEILTPAGVRSGSRREENYERRESVESGVTVPEGEEWGLQFTYWLRSWQNCPGQYWPSLNISMILEIGSMHQRDEMDDKKEISFRGLSCHLVCDTSWQSFEAQFKRRMSWAGWWWLCVFWYLSLEKSRHSVSRNPDREGIIGSDLN